MRVRKAVSVLVGCALMVSVTMQSGSAFDYSGQAWCCDTVYYYVNPTNPTLTCGDLVIGDFFQGLIETAASSWNHLGTQFHLTDVGTTAVVCTVATAYPGFNPDVCMGIKDGQNTVSMATGCSWTDNNVIAYSTWWYWTGGDSACCIFESDVCFNNNVRWFHSYGTCSGSCYDLLSVATHELGHWVSSGHENHNATLGYKPVMYFQFNYCEQRRDITADDSTLVFWAYDSLGSISLSHRCAGVHYHPPYPAPPPHDSCDICLSRIDVGVNGRFENGTYADGDDSIPNGWTKVETFSGGGDEASFIKVRGANGPTLLGDSALLWYRNDSSHSSGDWTAVQQNLSYDISACSCVILTADIKVLSHSLGGSGSTSSEFEFPATLMINYKDVAGTSRFWQWGWYEWIDGSTGPNPDHKAVPGNGVVTGQQVPAKMWVHSSFDLMTELVSPDSLTRIRIGGSGWDFYGMADNIQLLLCDTSCCVNRGNADGIIGIGGPVDVADLTYLVAYLFQGGPAPPCLEEGNVDGITGVGGPIDVADLTYLVAYLFLGGPAPPPC